MATAAASGQIETAGAPAYTYQKTQATKVLRNNYTIHIHVNNSNAKPEEIARAVQKAIAKTKERKFEDDE